MPYAFNVSGVTIVYRLNAANGVTHLPMTDYNLHTVTLESPQYFLDYRSPTPGGYLLQGPTFRPCGGL
jgi:hypothetical protein